MKFARILNSLFCLICFFDTSQETVAIDRLAVRLIRFEDVRIGEKLETEIFLSVKYTKSILLCTLYCSYTKKCRSFNFCGRGRCELNSHDVHSLGSKDGDFLHPKEECSYHGMTRTHIPTCNVKEVPISITGPRTDLCPINDKRVDREWSSWGPIQKIENTGGREYKEYQEREILVDVAHGGLSGDGVSKRTLTHLRGVTPSRNWNKAVSSCENMGGILFSNLDGTREQLKLLHDLVEPCWVWLGIEKRDGEYKRVGGGTISGSLFPNKPWGHGPIRLCFDGTYYFKIVSAAVPECPVCDML